MISLAQMAASAALGAFIGYFTNAVAIKSLFRPLRPRWYSLGWQGVVPRNRAKLADNIARVVGQDLLGRDYLVAQIQQPALQESLRGFIDSQLGRLLSLSLAEVFSHLPAGWQEEGLEAWTRRALEGLADWSEGEAGQAVKSGLIDALEGHLRELEMADLLQPEQAEGLVAGLGNVLAREETRQQLTRMLGAQIEAYLAADTPLEEVMPAELCELLHDKLREQVPAVMRRLAVWLASAENVEHMSRRILTALEVYTDEETGWTGLFGEIGLRLFGEQIRTAIMERIPQVAHDYLHSQEIRERVEEQLIGSINSLLRRPLGEVIGPHQKALAARIGAIAATWLASAEMQERLGGFLLGAYRERAGKRLAELLPEAFWGELRSTLLAAMRLSREQAAEWSGPLSGWARERVRQSRTELRQWAGLGAESEAALSEYVRERATEVLRTEVPVLVEQLDIAQMVHAKIMGFDLLRVEQLVKDIISDQLRYINLLGGLLGGLVGLLLPFVNAYLRTVGL